jgi:phage gp46-like protein
MSGIDIALQQDERGMFDIGIDPATGDFLLASGFDTALTMSLFCERRADTSEVPTAELRRGWWGNEVGPEGFEIGSKLWLLYQARKTQDTLNKANNYSRRGTQWLVDDSHLVNIDVATKFTSTGGSIEMRLNRSNSPTETKSYELWENTEALNAI